MDVNTAAHRAIEARGVPVQRQAECGGILSSGAQGAAG